MKIKAMKITGLLVTLVMLVTILGAIALTASAVEDLTVSIGTDASITIKDNDGDGYYDIGNANDLYALAALVNNGNRTINAELTADITVNSGVLKSDGSLNGDGSNLRVWTPIGSLGASYSGNFNGNGYSISGLYYNDTTKDYIGFIGYGSGSIENLTLKDSYIKAKSYVGGIVGSASGSVTNCVNYAAVIGSQYIGGIMGYSRSGSGATISHCINYGTISAVSRVGGITGYFQGKVTNCVNDGIVTGSTTNTEASGVGGIVGSAGTKEVTVNYCYNTGAVTGYNNVGGIVGEGGYSGKVHNCVNRGKVTGYFGSRGVFGSGCVGGIKNTYSLDGSYEFKSYPIASDVIVVTEAEFESGAMAYVLGEAFGQNIDNDKPVESFPVYGGERVYYGYANSTGCGAGKTYSNRDVPVNPYNHDFTDVTDGICAVCDHGYQQPTGNGTSSSPYLIVNAGNLYWFAEQVNAGKTGIYGKLGADIIVNKNVLKSDLTLNGDGSGFREWIPIGNEDNIFRGGFDGAGFTISGLYYNHPGNSDIKNIGLFGRASGSPTSQFVKNVTVVDTYFNAGLYVGGIVGYSGILVENCSFSGLVNGSSYVGGIVGINVSEVNQCMNFGAVTSKRGTVGGIAGENYNSSDIISCVNFGVVTGAEEYVGGITSYNNNGALVSDCYNLGEVNGKSGVGGVVGRNAATIKNCYNIGTINVSGSSDIGAIVGKFTSDRITNCYYLNTCGAGGSGTAKTAEQFASGEVAYLLGSVWGQTVGENGDAYPVFATDANKIYQHTNCDGVSVIYSNSTSVTAHQSGVIAAEYYNAEGICKTCGTQAAAKLTTADATPVVTYYMTLEDAIAAAQRAEASTLTLLDDCASSINDWFTITSGSFKINFNGKNLMPMGDSNRALSIEGGNITLFDDNEAQGGASKVVVVLDATLTIDGGIFEGVVKVDHENGTLIINNGTISQVEHVKGALTIKGGELSLLLVYKSSGKTPADVLPKDYYFYDKNGKIINAGEIAPDLYKYRVGDFTVKKGADISKDAVITVENVVYDGTMQPPSVTVTVGGVTLDYGEDYLFAVAYGEQPCDAGDYPITITGRGNYTGSVEKTYTIEKATPKVGDFSGAIPNDQTYDGTAKTAFIEAKSGIVGMGAITVQYYDAEGNLVNGAPTNAGTYTVKIDVAEGDNYEAVTDLEIGSFTIAKATPTVTAPTAIEGLIYNGEAQALANAGETTGGKMQYAVYRGVYDGSGVPNSVWEDTVRPSAAVGTYSVLYRVVGDDNYESVALQYFTVTIGAATPTLDVKAPVTTVLPGNTILLSYTLTGVKGEELTNLVGIGSAKVGDLDCVIDGLKVTVPSTAVIGGADKLVVTLTSVPGGNYGASEEVTLTLDVGMADFSGEIAELEADIDELNRLIANMADAAAVNQKLNELLSKIEALEAVKDDYKDADATLKSELESAIATAKQQAIDAAAGALDQAKAELNETIANKADKTALDQAIGTLNAAIANAETVAKTYADTQDATLKSELEQSIADAMSEITQAYEQAIADAVEKLEAADKTNADALAAAVESLEALIEAAEAYADTQDATLKAALEEQILKANELIASLDQRVGEAEKAIDEIETAIENLKATDAADAKALEDAIAALEKAIGDAKQAAVDADAALKKELNDKVETADAALEAKVAEVQANLNKAVEDLKAADTSNSDALAKAIETLNNAIDAAEAAAVTGDTALDGKITEAQTALDAKIAEVQGNLDQAKVDLEQAIKSGDAALDGKIANLNSALDAAKAALEATDAANKTELEGKITDAQRALQEAIDNVQVNLDNAKAELDQAIADLDAAMKQGDADLSDEIADLNTALNDAKAALEKADADNKAELLAKIEAADTALDEAIKTVQKNLEDAKNELLNAINANEIDIEDKVTNLNAALESAKAALEAADAANKTELVTKIETADATLDAAIQAVQKNLDAAKTELNEAIASGDKALSAKIDALNTALADAQSVLGKADADNKAELVAKIETADATLDAAIKAVESNLETAKTELNEAIASGDKVLSDKIDALNAALADAQSVLGKADADNKAELVAKIETADATLDAAIQAVQKNLDAAKTELNEAIASGDKVLSDKIDALNAALADAQSVLGKADADNKAELVAKIETADATLDAAIKAVESNLDAARVELNEAIENGDAALDQKIEALNEALTQAQAALKATAEADKSELAGKIDQGYASLEAAIKAVQTNLDAAKTELQEAIDALKAEQQSLAEQLANAEAEAEQSEKKTQTTQIVSVAAVASVNAGLLAGAFFFLRRKKLF